MYLRARTGKLMKFVFARTIQVSRGENYVPIVLSNFLSHIVSLSQLSAR